MQTSVLARPRASEIPPEPRSIVLLEGRRELPTKHMPRLIRIATNLAQLWPETTFRTGNARGSDTLFAQGLCEVDPTRLEYILPYRGMGCERATAASPTLNLEDVPDEEVEALRLLCRQASPLAKGAFDRPYWEITHRHTAFSARYLLRDALKVVGSRHLGFAPAACAIFYVDARDPHLGGTGHTLRLCELCGIPFYTQHDWFKWL